MDKLIIKRQDRIDYIINGVCEFFDITLDELKSRRRNPDKYNRKRMAIKVLHDYGDISFRVISETFNGNSPSSMFLAYEGISLDVDPDTYGNKEVKKQYNDLLKHLKL